MKRILVILRGVFRERFDLNDDRAEEDEIVLSIRRNVEFKGSNLWTLIFAIFIASIGLNVNSTAVVIGAMLISPLMGPIMGMGLGIGINDLALVRSGLKNLLIASFFSILTSTFYFWLTPLHEAQSELLARTTPSIWDVFIAFFGGLAGIVAGTRKVKSNVIPGVAIATALMPPLCTAGFGLGTGNLYFFMGALYLFFINCVFICISTFLMVRFLKFSRKEFPDKRIEKRVSRTILWVVTLTTLPSIYLAYKIVEKSIFESNARTFLASEFRFPRTQVINSSFSITDGIKKIDLLLIGDELSSGTLSSIQKKLPAYNLENTQIDVKQGLNAKQEVDFTAIKASILQEVFNQSDSASKKTDPEEENFKNELALLYPEISYYSLNHTVFHATTLPAQTDTALVAIIGIYDKSRFPDTTKFVEWIKLRKQVDSVKLVVD